MVESAFRFFHDQLPDDRQRAFYDAVEAAIRSRRNKIKFPRLLTMNESDYMRILEYVYDDHPEFFSFFPLRSKITLDSLFVTISLFYRCSAEKQTRYELELECAVEKIIMQCFPNGWRSVSEIRREKKIFDWITQNVVYDQKSIDYVDARRVDDQTRSVAWSAYGALVLREAVCEGIACAFKLLCNQVGLPSIVVLGTAGGGRHAWNLVRVHGKFYQVDCTWDLRTSISTHIPYMRYRYFNLSDKIITATHTAETKFLPMCGSLQYNPFRIRKLCATGPEEIEKIAIQQADNGENRFAVMVIDCSAKDYGQVVAQRLAEYVHGHVTYYMDDSGFFIGFVIEQRGDIKYI